MERRRTAGFTLLEMMVVVAIIAIVAGLGIFGFGAQRHRQRLGGAQVDLLALVHAARQNALATGRQTVVLVFPDAVVNGDRTGRLVIWDQTDETVDFFDDAAPTSFDAFDPTATPPFPGGNVIATLEIPDGVVFGPRTGYGGTAQMPAPIPLDSDCTFCLGTGRRGAIAFDGAGTPTFHSGNGTAGLLTSDDYNFGVSLSLMSKADLPGGGGGTGEMKVLLVVAPTGAMQTLSLDLPRR